MATKVAAVSSRPKVRLTKLFIDNKWTDPVDGGEFETLQPGDRRGDRQGRRRRARPTSTRRSRPPGGPGNRAVEHDGRRRSRQAALQARRPGRAECRRAGRARIAQLRQDDQRLEGRHGRGRQHPALLCRLGRQDRGADRPGPRQLPVVHAPPAGGRGRPDHPLELPAPDARVEVGPGPGLRQHGRDEAGRADAADGASRWPSWPRRPASRRA